MGQKISIGRDANGSEIKIDNTEFNTAIEHHVDLLLNKWKQENNFNQQINDVLTKLENIEQEIKKNSTKTTDFGKKPPKNRNNWFCRLFKNHWFLIVILIVLLAVDICLKISPNVITKESIVLTFVGILATFVVVGNYFQVKEIEKKFDDKTNGLDSKINSNINVLKRKIELESIDAYESLYANLAYSSMKFKDYKTAFSSNICLIDYGLKKGNNIHVRLKIIREIIKIIEESDYNYSISSSDEILYLSILNTINNIDIMDVTEFIKSKTLNI
jgi:NADH:ubiquinone oxidoreductase subunit 3 (subunit A)